MYSKKQDFHQQYPYTYPFYTTCNPTTLKCSETMSGNSNTSILSKRTSSILISVKSAQDEDDEYYDIPEKTPHKMSRASTSSYWSWTFGITAFPFIFWGCPVYTVLIERYPIRTTRKWLKCLVDCSTYPFSTILTFFLLIATVAINVYFFYLFGTLFESLFITGEYTGNMFKNLLEFLRYIPVIIPINYVWLCGFKINNIISLLNQKHRMYSQIACSGYRIKLMGMLVIIVCVHVIRYFSYKKYTFEDLSFFGIWHTIWNFSADIFVTLTLPVYCAFCYAIRFELSTIKADVYEMISNRVTPNINHLSKFKMLYTHAADHINSVNALFAKYLSLTIVLTIIGTFIDADNLATKVAGVVSDMISKIFGDLFGGGAPIIDVVKGFMNESLSSMNETLPFPPPSHFPPIHVNPLNRTNQTANNGTISVSSVVVRQINADIACIILTYAIIFYTIWQAVVTNDWAREVHVWLNDFVSGAGGTDVKAALMDLGIVKEDDHVNNMSSGLEDNLQHSDRIPDPPVLIWARNRKIHDGQTDQFLEKFQMLKAYIHVRMQLETPALLTITLVGVIVPSLSGRLKRYRVMN